MKRILKLSLTAAFFAGWGIYIHDRQLDVHRIELRHEKLPEAFDGVKIIHLSDLHQKTFGEMNGNLIISCEAVKPDYIFFTGDLISRNENRSFFDAKLFLMEKLTRLCPVYYIPGNHEQDSPENTIYLCRKLRKLGVKILINKSDTITREGESVRVWGLMPSIRCYHNGRSFRHLKKIDKAYITELLGQCSNDEFNILLSHTPFAFEEYEKWGADLIFAGHCHGGIIRLPFLGGLLSPERRFFPKYTKGTYFLENSKMVVSAGLGKFRVNNPSEIVVVTLKKG